MPLTDGDHSISTPNGTLFAKSWSPSHPHPTTRATTILLFHDSLGCVDLWRDFPEQLASATRLRVIAYDRLGFGRSDPHPGRLPVTFISDEATFTVPMLCDALGLRQIIPFGHSVGGGMAIATAARWPDRCAALITESAQSFNEDVTIAGIRNAQANFARPGQFERLHRYHGEKSRWVLNSWIDTWLSPAFAAWSLDSELAQVRCPTLAIHGDHDEFGSTVHAHRITSLTQGRPSQSLIVPACGHIPHREHPALVLQAIARFLA